MRTYINLESAEKTKIGTFIPFVFICIIVFATNPFLKLPFDPWEHLIKIRSIFDDGRCFLYWPESKSTFCSWHMLWANIFSIMDISDAFLWATIIHYTQFIFSLSAIFYFSYSVSKLFEKQSPSDHLIIVALFSMLYWLLGNGTFSVQYQQAWIMWYSVTYQGFTIPLFWLITGLTLQLFFKENLSRLKIFSSLILVLSGFFAISFFHPSEAIYYFIFLILSLFFTPLISFRLKLIFSSIFIFTIPLVLYVIANHINLPFLQGVSIHSDLAAYIQQINIIGKHIVERGGNRFQSSFSELAIFSSIVASVYWLASLLLFKKKPARIFTLFIVALAIFFLIPTYKWFAGITGLLLHKNIIWRFFFASPWFLFLPLITFKVIRNRRFPKIYASVFLIAILPCAFFVSDKYLNKALSGNIRSLINAFDKDKTGLQYNEDTLTYLKQIIENETKGVNKRDAILYLRGDLATLARAVYGYYALSHRRTSIPMHKFFADRMDQRYQFVHIDLPIDFPKDRNIFLHFKLDVKKISERHDLLFKGSSTVKFKLEHTDASKSFVYIEGWSFLAEQKGPTEVFIVLQSNNDTIIFDTSRFFRKDVGKYFQSRELENTGFLSTIKNSDLRDGTYRIGLYVKQNGHEGYVLSERYIKLPRSKRH